MFPTDGSRNRVEDTSQNPEHCGSNAPAKVYQYFVPSPVGNVEITSMHNSRPKLPFLNASFPDEEEPAEHIEVSCSGVPVHRAVTRSRQLQVHLPRTPSTPGASPASGPWHGRLSDGSSSKSSSPGSNKSSPATDGKPSPGREQDLNDPKPGLITRFSSIKETDQLPRLTRRHTYPSFSVLQDMVQGSVQSTSPGGSLPPEVQPEVNRPSSLEEAVTLQEPEMVAWYLKQESNPNGDMDSKVSPLILAASAGNEKIVRMLLGAGANIDYQDSSNGTALHHAAAGGHRNVVKLLLVAGANMFKKTDEGHLAVQLTSDSRIRHLLACRMRSNSEGNLAQSPGLDLVSSNPLVKDSSTPSLNRNTKQLVGTQGPVVLPVQVLPLPRNEHGCLETTTMQRVSPRSESPKNIHRLQHKKEKLKEKLEVEEKEEGRQTGPLEEPVERRSSESPKHIHRLQHKKEKLKQKLEFEEKEERGPLEEQVPSKHSKQLEIVEEKTEDCKKQKENGSKVSGPAACRNCGKDDCGGKCQQQPAGERKQQSAEGESSSEGVAAKLFSKPEPKTTGTFKWTKGELLGEGAYGKVFSGLNQSTGELMAVKQLKIDPAEGQERGIYLAALEREIGLYKKLRHKHIVGYINMEQDIEAGSLYIFLEYVSGGSIQSMLERFGRFSEALVRLYTRQLLLGLQYLHENRIVHRDIKGGNVLVDAVGVVKLADFGASKAFHDPTVTNECKSIRGSVFWMAPEVIKGDGYGRRADIWSVGCTVIEMLTATHPWPNIDNTWSAIFHIAKASSGPPIPENVSDCVKDFIHQCFQLDPRLRPTAAQLLEHPFVAISDDD